MRSWILLGSTAALVGCGGSSSSTTCGPGTNKVGDPHTFTVTVEKNLGTGGGWVPASGVTVTGTESGVGSITADGNCDDTPTDVNGQCTIVVTSSAVFTVTTERCTLL